MSLRFELARHTLFLLMTDQYSLPGFSQKNHWVNLLSLVEKISTNSINTISTPSQQTATGLPSTADDICIPEGIAEGIAEGTGIAEKSGPEEETFSADDERSIAEEIGPSILALPKKAGPATCVKENMLFVFVLFAMFEKAWKKNQLRRFIDVLMLWQALWILLEIRVSHNILLKFNSIPYVFFKNPGICYDTSVHLYGGVHGYIYVYVHVGDFTHLYMCCAGALCM